MNPNLTANLRAERELHAQVLQEIKVEIQKQLEIALLIHQGVYEAADKAGFRELNYECFQAIGEALTACTEALERINDQPDQ